MSRSIYRAVISSFLSLVLMLTAFPLNAKKTEQDVGALVQTLYESGQSRYEEEQYVAAATLWNEALDLLLEQDPEHPTTQMILLGIVDAYRQASIRSANPEAELRAAMNSLTVYRQALGQRSPSAEIVDAQSELQREIDKLEPSQADFEEGDDEFGAGGTTVSMRQECVRDNQCAGHSACVNGRCADSIATDMGRLDYSSQLTKSGRWVLVSGGLIVATGLLITILGVVRGNDLYRRYDQEFEKAKMGSKTFADVDNTYRIYQRFQGLYLSGFGVIGGGAVAVVCGAILLSYGKKLRQGQGYSVARRKRWQLAPAFGAGLGGRHYGLRIQGNF